MSATINSFLVPHIEKLIHEGNLVDCACHIDEEVNQKLIDLNVKVYNLPFTRSPLAPINMKAFKQLIEIQEVLNYDIVHVHTPIAALYGRLLKVKFPALKTIYTVHGFHFYKGAPIINWGIYYPIERLMSHYTDTIITINEEDYEAAKKLKIKETHFVNGVGVDLTTYNNDLYDRNEMRRKLNLQDDDFVIMMIAEVNKNKNHKQMIHAVECLKNKGINVKVLCAGDGPLLEEQIEYIKSRNLTKQIKFLGLRTDISELIVACDMGILTSYREGLPRNIMELMACKKPVIGTDIRGIRDLVQDGVTGLLVKVGDYEKTAAKIEQLYHDRKLLKKLGSNAYECIKKYDVNQVMESLETVYS